MLPGRVTRLEMRISVTVSERRLRRRLTRGIFLEHGCLFYFENIIIIFFTESSVVLVNDKVLNILFDYTDPQPCRARTSLLGIPCQTTIQIRRL